MLWIVAGLLAHTRIETKLLGCEFIKKLSSSNKRRKRFELGLGGVRQALAIVQLMGDA
jgi:hypothetical protein